MSNNTPYARVVALIDKGGKIISSNDDIEDDADFVELVISAGQTRGVSLDLRFVVYELGVELFDPDSGVSLGRYELVKGEGKTTHVMPGMSRLRSTDLRKVPVVGVRVSGSPQFRTIARPFAGARIGDAVRPV